MKNTFEISKSLNVAYSTISRAVKKLQFVPVATKGHIKYYDAFQIGLLIEHLENRGQINNNLRTILEIAKVCNTDYNAISRIIQREDIKPIKLNPLRFNENQQCIIFTFLYYEKKMEFLTFESKINIPEIPKVYNHEEFIKNQYKQQK